MMAPSATPARETDMERTGGCACGAIRFTLTAPFIATGACHCTACQKASGGGANYVGIVPREALVVTTGAPKVYRTPGDSGGMVDRAFCPDCGTPLWAAPESQAFVTIKVGALDDARDFTPALHVYASSAPAWHPMDDGAPRFDKMPPAA